ncbi:MAG: helix-turn-helix domain-containing protein [Nanoarchaeota archaeon]
MSAIAELGLSPYEEKVYVALLRGGILIASAISKKSGVPPTAVYPNLKKLVAKGLVQRMDGQPAQYQAIDPSLSVKSMLDARIHAYQSMQAGIIAELAALQAERDRPEQIEPVKLALGAENSWRITNEFLRSARRSVHIIGWRFSTNRHLHDLLKHLDRARRDIDVKLIITGKEDVSWNTLKMYEKRGVPMKYYPLSNFSIITMDRAQCKITLKSPELAQRMSLFITDPHLSGFLDDYLLSIWSKATPLR